MVESALLNLPLQIGRKAMDNLDSSFDSAGCRAGPQRPKLRRSPTLRKIDRITTDDISRSVHAVILAGGPSDNPLARYRAMPAVELGEQYLRPSQYIEWFRGIVDAIVALWGLIKRDLLNIGDISVVDTGIVVKVKSQSARKDQTKLGICSSTHQNSF